MRNGCFSRTTWRVHTVLALVDCCWHADPTDTWFRTSAARNSKTHFAVIEWSELSSAAQLLWWLLWWNLVLEQLSLLSYHGAKTTSKTASQAAQQQVPINKVIVIKFYLWLIDVGQELYGMLSKMFCSNWHTTMTKFHCHECFNPWYLKLLVQLLIPPPPNPHNCLLRFQEDLDCISSAFNVF